MQNEVLIRAYKKTRKLIEEEPNNKDNIINEYIDLVQKINDNNSNNNNNSINPELSKMLKNPLEIAIYNNFQKYNDKYIDDYNTNTNDDLNIKNKYDSSRFLASVYDLKYK